jgi:nitrile hydratase
MEFLGLPPIWCKSALRRSRVFKDPRGVLAEFGETLPMETEIRVLLETWLLVLPMRPPGTKRWSEDKLAELITRDSMIGTGLPTNPSEVR